MNLNTIQPNGISMSFSNKEKQIIAAVDTLEDDIIDLTARMVAQPSTLGNEQSVLRMMETRLSGLGFKTIRLPILPHELSAHPGYAPVPWDYDNRYNLVVTEPASGAGGRSALFNGHLDVVSPEPAEFWNHDPFDPQIHDGWMHGRGAGDMKSGVAAMIYAVQAVKKAGFGLNGPVTIETVIEEECSGNGALACLDAGLDAEAVLIPEPFGPTILTSQVGVAWFKVTLNGVPKHVLDTHSGVNAIEKCYPLFKALRRLEEELNRETHPAFVEVRHPANLNIGIIKSGDWPSTVPASAEFHCRIGFLPGTNYGKVQKLVKQAIAQAAADDNWLADNQPIVEFYGFRSEGHYQNLNLPAFKQLSDCHRTLTGVPAKAFVSTATTDLRSFVHFGRGQATCFGPVAENIHAENERVKIDSIIHTAKVYALFLIRWCGLVS
jgi:acetylornithine deacetylase